MGLCRSEDVQAPLGDDYINLEWYLCLYISQKSHLSPVIIISPNEVFGDIMVLASPRPPADPDDVDALNRKIFNGSLSKFI